MLGTLTARELAARPGLHRFGREWRGNRMLQSCYPLDGERSLLIGEGGIGPRAATALGRISLEQPR